MAYAIPARERFGPAILGLAVLVMAFVTVEILIDIGLLNAFVVPKPSQVVGSFYRVVTEEDILGRFLVTARECVIATAMVVVIGGLIGASLHQVPLLRRATETWVAAAASAPIVLMYPLFLVIFGRSAWTIIMMGFLSGLPPVILKTIEGLSGTRGVLVNVGRSFMLTRSQMFWKILFPSALPAIFVGLRLGLIFALINVVGVEFLINLGGLGQLINDLSERYDLPGTYAAICFVILISVGLFMAAERAERWLTRLA